jgi:mRNA-degrading endonuclease toxin of MazEF toxin-antitoxin module
VVRASVRDARGHAKHRPLVILSSTEQIERGEPVMALAVTTTFADPPPDDHVPLPWHPQGRAGTKLRKRSAAVLSWIVEIDPEDVVEFYGEVPPRLMIQILERFDDA